MKIYSASVYASNFNIVNGPRYTSLNETERRYRENVRYILESYHYVEKERYTNWMAADKQRIFLDSGAFSAFSKGAVINLPGYVEFIKRNLHIIDNVDGNLLASVLDGIGDPMLTYQNQMTMEAHGVRPLPCFHYGEDERYLDYYTANYTYITLGGMVPISTPQLYYWLDRIWDRHLTDGAGRPKTRVHGFGLTTLDLMTRYPWYSVDSSSWQQSGTFGSIIDPDGGTITLSNDSPALKEAGKHYATLPPIQQAEWRRIIESRGFDVDRLRERYYCRWLYNIVSYMTLEDRLNSVERTFKTEQPMLF